ncbi:type I-F CRISPR-associated protein Csy2 [Paraburkholderia sp. Ac-20340]|uniref:type I-F CRISPR-associated protein Csy2 n=1 Tax=Paraburkholderia sp. Ac-20340 TaxID=2703888 RepID=UPI00197FA270|nr:type I-F CRISPR-associated protein Csy2 [Paraburkholderia sp. Ac-20340]MBN3857920.1 type I-F CRISPR-associated protein Csy2 [Paraburkholderia sp. Ac-20340]
MSERTNSSHAKALIVLPYLRVQNANAISSPLTHGFPSITALNGTMWALQRQLRLANIPLNLHRVGVICHRHEEQVEDGYVKTFRLTRNPLEKDGGVAAIVEAGRIHLEITLLFEVTQHVSPEAIPQLTRGNEARLNEWAARIGEIVQRMRIAGGTLLPVRRLAGKLTRPWMEVLPEDMDEKRRLFARWRRQWLPGYALVSRDDLLATRHEFLRLTNPDVTLVDAWLHAARFNYESTEEPGANIPTQAASETRHRWSDPQRQKGAGWTVPIPVGYAALQPPLAAGSVANTRDPDVPFVLVESIYSFGEWISPHRLNDLDDLFWRPEVDLEKGVYRCRGSYTKSDLHLLDSDEALPEFE